jgi:hypothetical protein
VPSRQLLYYFEVQVKDRGAKGFIGVGFTDRHFKLSRQPGCGPPIRTAESAFDLCVDPHRPPLRPLRCLSEPQVGAALTVNGGLF